MARVPGYGDLKVGRELLPTARKSMVDTPESLGAGVGQAIEGFGNALGRDAAQRLAQEKQRADDVANLGTLQKFNDIEHRLLRDPESGILTKQGLDPMAQREATLEAFDKETGDLETGLQSPEQRQFYSRLRVERRDQVRNTIDAHADSEFKKYEESEAQGALSSSVNAAIASADGDPNVWLPRVAQELETQTSIVDKHLHLGPEASRALKDKLASATHVGIIDRLLARGNTAGAKAYFEEATGRGGYGARPDGTPKGDGYFGPLAIPGGVATEYSVGVQIDGKEVDVPTLVPTLTKEEVQATLAAAAAGQPPSDAVVQKAADYARQRIADGKSPFAGAGEQDRKAYPELPRAHGAIAGDQIDRLERAIREGEQRDQAQRESDRIFASTSSLKDALTEAATIKDPQVRQEVERSLEHRHQVQANMEAADHDAMFLRAVNTVWAQGSLKGVPVNEFSQFTLPEKNGLQNIIDARVARSQERKSNEVYLARLIDESATDPQKFLAHDNGEVIRNLSRADAEQYFRQRAAMRNNQAEDAAKAAAAFAKLSIGGTEVRNGMIDRALRNQGVDPKPPMPGDKNYDETIHAPQNAVVDGFYRAVRDTVAAAERRKGGPIDDKEYQGIVDALGGRTGRNVILKDKWGPWNDTRPQLLFEGVPEVPPGELGAVVDALRQAGRPVTADAVRDLYTRTQQRLKAQVPKQ